VAAPNALPQLNADTPLEVFAYDRANVKMLANGRHAGAGARQRNEAMTVSEPFILYEF
jgi:hypothetical protein